MRGSVHRWLWRVLRRGAVRRSFQALLGAELCVEIFWGILRRGAVCGEFFEPRGCVSSLCVEFVLNMCADWQWSLFQKYVSKQWADPGRGGGDGNPRRDHYGGPDGRRGPRRPGWLVRKFVYFIEISMCEGWKLWNLREFFFYSQIFHISLGRFFYNYILLF